MSADGVTTAFEVILEELGAVVAEVNAQGAQCMKDGKYDDAQQLIESGKKLQHFKEKLDALRSEWSSGHDNTTRNRVKIENVRSLTSHHKAPKTGLLVRFRNGKIINESIAAETFSLALQEFGFDRVRSLNKQVNEVPLVSSKKHETYSQHRIGSHYIMTHSNTVSKKRMLVAIAKELGIQVDVEIIK
jgi:hypothetical protein